MENKIAFKINDRVYCGLSLERSLGKVVKRAVKNAKRDIARCNTASGRLEERTQRTAREKNVRRERYIKRKRASERKYADYQRAVERENKARLAAGDAMDKHGQAERALDLMGREKVHKTQLISTMAELYGSDAYDRRAELLRSILPLIDTTRAIQILTDVSEGQGQRPHGSKLSRMRWRTGDVHILDKDGGTLPFNFGKFDITVDYIQGEGGAFVNVWVKTPTPKRAMNAYGEEQSRYYHPHVESDGKACLGNAARMLMTHMKNMDYAMVVYTITEFLIKYNPESPYQRLSYWVPNKFESQWCESGQHLLCYCDCTRCAVTGNITTEDLAPCGATNSMCMVHHVFDPEAPTQGINGTGCVPRAYANQILNREAEAL